MNIITSEDFINIMLKEKIVSFNNKIKPLLNEFEIDYKIIDEKILLIEKTPEKKHPIIFNYFLDKNSLFKELKNIWYYQLVKRGHKF